jgi:hypothetical protein
MTETDPGEMPATDAIASETPEPVESSTTEVSTPDDAGQQPETERDDRGRFTGAQKRIDELTRNWREAERREAALLAALQQREQPAPKEPEPVKLPTLEEVGFDEAKYQAALIQYATQQAEQVVTRRLSEADAQRAEQGRLSTFAERQREFAKATPDFEDKVMHDPTLPISAAMRDVILDSPSGPELAYYLANNRNLADQIAKLPPHLAALELGRVEGRLQATREAKAKVPVVTRAPPPPPTIEAVEPDVGAPKASDPDSDKLSTEQWARLRDKELRRKR